MNFKNIRVMAFSFISTYICLSRYLGEGCCIAFALYPILQAANCLITFDTRFKIFDLKNGYIILLHIFEEKVDFEN